MTTRTTFLLLLGLAIASLAGCSFRVTSTDGYQFDWRGDTAVRQEDGVIAADIRQIEVKNRFGAVRVEVAEGEPNWSWELTCWSSTEEMAETLAAKTTLQVHKDTVAQKWEVVLPEPPQTDLRGVRSNLFLRVPASVHVTVDNSFGNTVVRDVQGGTIAKSRHGDLKLFDLAESLEATNAHGSIQAERIPAARLVNKHGPITVSDVAGGLEVHNQHGEVKVGGVLGGLQVENEHGNVVASEIAEQTEISTSFASIQLDGTDGDVVLHNQHGNITARRIRGNVVAGNQHGTIDLNVDSAEVVCTNQHGKIRLHLRNPELFLVKAETSHSELRIEIPEAISLGVEARADHGKVHSDVPVFAAGTGGNNLKSAGFDPPRVLLKNRYGNIFIRQFAPNLGPNL